MKLVFKSIFKLPTNKGEKLFHPFVKQYEEIGPYEKNPNTGEILNNTDKKIWKEVEPVNIYDLIQSHGPEADLVSKVKHMTTPKDLQQQTGVYLDLTQYGNIHETHEKTEILGRELAKLEAEAKAKKQELEQEKLKEQAINDYLTKQKQKETENAK